MIYLTNNYFKHEKRGEREREGKRREFTFFIFLSRVKDRLLKVGFENRA